MHTLVTLEDGVMGVTLTLQPDDDVGDMQQPVAIARWRQVIEPGVQFLQVVGGGAILMPHRPEDLRT